MANTTPTHRPLRQDELDAGLEASRLFEGVAFTAAVTLDELDRICVALEGGIRAVTEG